MLPASVWVGCAFLNPGIVSSLDLKGGAFRTPYLVVDLGLKKIHLDYKTSRCTDEHGNQFRYLAKVKDTRDAQLRRGAWDGYLVRAQ